MKKIAFLSFAFLLLLNTAFAQAPKVVKWTWKAEVMDKGVYKLVFHADIDAPWHTYSLFIGDGGPVPTAVVYDKNKDVVLKGKAMESGAKIHDEHDPVFDMQLKWFEGSMTIEQKVRAKKDTKLKGHIEYMACNDKECLPPDYDVAFEFDLKGGGEEGIGVDTDEVVIKVDTVQVAKVDTVTAATTVTGPCDYGKTGFDPKHYGPPLKDCGKQIETFTVWDTLLQGLLWGLIAVFMPCVFPMIPLTVSFFTKRSESKAKGVMESLAYAFFIVFIYFLFSTPFVFFGASHDSLNIFATDPYLNIGFFVIFIVFAFSFFGFYDISLPNAIVNRSESASNAGGFIGVFFMALTLVLISFSCTGPLLANLIGNAAAGSGGKIRLMVGFTSFGFAIALPFALFSLFPQLMKKLPRSGGWMNTFKVVLGFVELILAFKYLANADNVKQWGLVKREIFLGAWAALSFALFLYLIGVFVFTKEHSDGKITLGRYGLALVALAFSIYSAYGMYCNPVPLFAGFPPPKEYSWCKECDGDKKQDGLKIYRDYCEAFEAAKRENKAVMIDFTGWACINCRKMEENVWTRPEVFKELNENYIILSLYVDERQSLPESEQYYSKVLDKQVKTVGNKWSDLENSCFGQPSQPYYALISPDEHLLNDPRGYTQDPAEYLKWLQCGAEANQELKAEKK